MPGLIMAIRKVIRLKVLTDTSTWCSILGTIAFSPFLKEKENSLQDIVSFAELGLWPGEVLVVTFVVSREPELPVIQFVGIDRVTSFFRHVCHRLYHGRNL
jgi:hypothetical protein